MKVKVTHVEKPEYENIPWMYIETTLKVKDYEELKVVFESKYPNHVPLMAVELKC
jgi:hypothetical protein